jgi:tetratricopeptide (TPR) repeat protein
MKKSVLCLLTIIISWTGTFAQTRSFGEFNMIPKKFATKGAMKKAIKTGPAFEKSVKVYSRLVEARGDFRYPVPEFAITGDTSGVASIQYGDPVRIFLSEKAFRVCEGFGNQSEAAIAFLLGHELTHYYEKHAWRSDFELDNANLGIAKEMDSLFIEIEKTKKDTNFQKRVRRFDDLLLEFKNVEREAQCDYLGGFLAYSAGFGSLHIGPKLIGKLYKAFDLSDHMEGYVSRTEREDMSERSADRMNDLVDVFDMANLLVSIGKYDEAYQFYRTLLFEYQSREVYNNVGVTAMLQALKFFTANEQIYRYPIQLDLDMANSRGEDEVAKRNKLLLQAIQHFEAAISLDHNYAPAYVNKACALALMGDTLRARFYAEVEAKGVAIGKYAKSAHDMEILLGILDALSGTSAGENKARERFSAIAKLEGGGLAAYNLAKLDHQSLPAPPQPPEAPLEEELIDGMDIFLLETPTADKKILPVGADIEFIRDSRKGPNSQLFGAGGIKMLITHSKYPQKTARGIGIGATRADIEKAYGTAMRSIRTPDGEILAYDDARAILFMLKGSTPKEQKLERWVLFKS